MCSSSSNFKLSTYPMATPSQSHSRPTQQVSSPHCPQELVLPACWHFPLLWVTSCHSKMRGNITIATVNTQEVRPALFVCVLLQYSIHCVYTCLFGVNVGLFILVLPCWLAILKSHIVRFFFPFVYEYLQGFNKIWLWLKLNLEIKISLNHTSHLFLSFKHQYRFIVEVCIRSHFASYKLCFIYRIFMDRSRFVYLIWTVVTSAVLFPSQADAKYVS